LIHEGLVDGDAERLLREQLTDDLAEPFHGRFAAGGISAPP
jgi:hypothetical protein